MRFGCLVMLHSGVWWGNPTWGAGGAQAIAGLELQHIYPVGRGGIARDPVPGRFGAGTGRSSRAMG